MVARARGYGNTALQTISGEIPNNLVLTDMFSIYEAGSPMSLTGIEFEFQFRSCRSDTADLVCSTDSGLTLTTAENEDGDSVDVVKFNSVNVSSLEGDYIADLIMKDAAGAYTHLAHGTVTFFNDPVTPTI